MTPYTIPAGPVQSSEPLPCLDVLPVRGGKRIALKWIHKTTDFSTLAGYVVLTDARDTAAYSVSEFPRSVGRGFMLTKVGGRVKSARQSGYAVECVTAGEEPTGGCECAGFAYGGRCRHLDAVATLLANGWL